MGKTKDSSIKQAVIINNIPFCKECNEQLSNHIVDHCTEKIINTDGSSEVVWKIIRPCYKCNSNSYYLERISIKDCVRFTTDLQTEDISESKDIISEEV